MLIGWLWIKQKRTMEKKRLVMVGDGMAGCRTLEELIKIGAYRTGADPIVDRAIALNPALENFLGQDKDDHTGLSDSFTRLEAILNQGMIRE